ncbi:MAG TPA: hypothetical protein VF826_19860 [Chloroflexia bacterium]|jgi:hypothetical protein
MAEQRYTLALPGLVYDELRKEADAHDVSIKEVVRQALKFGLVAMKLEADPNVDIIIRERIPSENGGGTEIKESHLKFIW